MLIKNYYSIDSRTTDGDKEIFGISLHPDCDVYRGHFPGTPVSPGVCNIEMIKECAELTAGKKLFLKNLQQCRLKTLITPTEHPQLEMTIALTQDGTSYKLKATLGKGNDIYLDLKADLVEEAL